MATLKVLIVKSKMPSSLIALADKSDELVIMNIPESNRSAAAAILNGISSDFYNDSELVTETVGHVSGIPIPKEAGKKYQ